VSCTGLEKVTLNSAKVADKTLSSISGEKVSFSPGKVGYH
jgi:hypothetical protein